MAETVWSDVLAGLPMPAMLVAREDRVTACNEPALALLGSAILGRNPAMAVRTPAVLQAIGTVARTGGVQEARMALRREGQEQLFQVTISAQGQGLSVAPEGRRVDGVLVDELHARSSTVHARPRTEPHTRA